MIILLRPSSSHNWNTLFVGTSAVADAIAEKYNTTKSQVLDHVRGLFFLIFFSFFTICFFSIILTETLKLFLSSSVGNQGECCSKDGPGRDTNCAGDTTVSSRQQYQSGFV